MQKFGLGIATITLASSLFGCNSFGQNSKLLGSWKLDYGGFGSGVWTYSSDNTFILTAGGESLRGKWKLEGNKLITTAINSTHSKDSNILGKEDTSEVIKLDDSVLILKAKDESGREQVYTLTKVR